MKTKFNAQQIIDLGCQYFDVPQDLLFSETRNREVVYPRQVIQTAIYNLARRQLSFPQIGALFNRHHTTVLHAVQSIEEGTPNKRTVQYKRFRKFLASKSEMEVQ